MDGSFWAHLEFKSLRLKVSTSKGNFWYNEADFMRRSFGERMEMTMDVAASRMIHYNAVERVLMLSRKTATGSLVGSTRTWVHALYSQHICRRYVIQ